MEIDIALTDVDVADTPVLLIVSLWENATEATLTFFNKGHAL